MNIITATINSKLDSASIASLSEEEALEALKLIRWEDGKPVCPRCNCKGVYTLKTRSTFKCKNCQKHFSVTSGTVFASHKLSYCDILSCLVYFVNTKRISALQWSKDLHINYRTAYSLLRRFRNEVILYGN